jgi:16S rRNA (adenine1518-N6/adenine1519-N6)-dimethyltransferase
VAWIEPDVRYSSLATPRATIARLQELGLYTKKSLGQHFLVDDNVVGRIIRLADISVDDTIIEVGPGIGTLTLALQDTGAQIIAVEYDEQLIAPLKDSTDPQHVSVIQGDAAKILVPSMVSDVDWVSARDDATRSLSTRRDSQKHPDARGLSEKDATRRSCANRELLQKGTKLVSNLPYQVAATVVLRFFEQIPTLTSATVMVQREVADRMKAKVGTKDYSGYSAKLQLLTCPGSSFEVARSAFLPPPRVDSTVIRLDRIAVGVHKSRCAITKGECNTKDVDCSGTERDRILYDATKQVIDAAFGMRRKTLRNNLVSHFGAWAVDSALDEAGIDGRVRAETLEPTQFIALATALVSSAMENA